MKRIASFPSAQVHHLPNMTKSAGIDLIKTAISSSRERDAGSGFKLQICTINKAGFKQIQ